MKRKPQVDAKLANTTGGEAADALKALRNEHKKVEALFEKFTGSRSRDEKADLIKQVCAELMTQTQLEEEILLESWPSGGARPADSVPSI
jgi:hemerythrin superfamily protein